MHKPHEHERVRALVLARSRSWWCAQVPVLALAIPAFVLTNLLSYPFNASTRILGFPFPVAAWQKASVGWMDFVDPLSPLALLANAAFMFLVPQLVLLRRLKGAGDSRTP